MLMMFTMGFCNNVFPVYLPYLEAGFLTGAQGSALISLRCLFGIAGMFLVERYYRLLTLRGGMAGVCFITALAYGLYSIADDPQMFYLAAAVSGFGYGFGSMIAVGMLIRNWFSQRQGTAVGISAAGSGISMILFPPLVTQVIERLGTTTAFRLQALLAGLAGLALWLLVRDTPSQMGLEPYGVSKEIIGEATQEKRNPYPHAAPESFLMLGVCVLIGGVAAAAPGHFSTLFSEQGYPMSQVSLGISTFGLALVLGKLCCGAQFDRLGGQHTALLFFGIALSGCGLCCISGGGSLLLMFGSLVLMGVGFAPATVGIPIWAADFSTESEYRKRLKWFQIAYSSGGVALSFLPGLIYDCTGSYLQSYALFAAILCVIIAGFLAAYKLKNLKGKNDYESV